MTLTFEPDLDSVRVKKRAKYLGQRSCHSKVIIRIHRHRQTKPTARPELL